MQTVKKSAYILYIATNGETIMTFTFLDDTQQRHLAQLMLERDNEDTAEIRAKRVFEYLQASMKPKQDRFSKRKSA